MQLHIHPQWLNGTYENGRWKLTSDWSLLNYEPDETHEMLANGKRYLDNLLSPLNREYRCLAFRAGALAIAPSRHLLQNLVSLGIKIDVSLAGGLYLDTHHLKLDFRSCGEDFLPFYPQLDDARRISKNPEQIVCVPLHHFHSSRQQMFVQHLAFARKALWPAKTGKDDYGIAEWARKGRSSLPARIFDKGILPYIKRKYLLADMARLSYPLLKEMLNSIRARVRHSGRNNVPVVITNHPKEIREYESIKRFVCEAAAAEDIKFITLTELAKGLDDGVFPIVRAGVER